jgi:hypothetical protein
MKDQVFDSTVCILLVKSNRRLLREYVGMFLVWVSKEADGRSTYHEITVEGKTGADVIKGLIDEGLIKTASVGTMMQRDFTKLSMEDLRTLELAKKKAAILVSDDQQLLNAGRNLGLEILTSFDIVEIMYRLGKISYKEAIKTYGNLFKHAWVHPEIQELILKRLKGNKNGIA